MYGKVILYRMGKRNPLTAGAVPPSIVTPFLSNRSAFSIFGSLNGGEMTPQSLYSLLRRNSPAPAPFPVRRSRESGAPRSIVGIAVGQFSPSSWTSSRIKSGL